MAKLYPFKSEKVKHLESAVMHLGKHITLPLEESVSFKDGLERWIDTDPKRIYLTTGMACKPALALASISIAVEVWMGNMEEVLKRVSEEMVKSLPLQELMLAAAFLGEASIYIFHLVA